MKKFYLAICGLLLAGTGLATPTFPNNSILDMTVDSAKASSIQKNITHQQHLNAQNEEWSAWEELGTCTVTYGNILVYKGVNTSRTMSRRVSATDATHVQYRIDNYLFSAEDVSVGNPLIIDLVGSDIYVYDQELPLLNIKDAETGMPLLGSDGKPMRFMVADVATAMDSEALRSLSSFKEATLTFELYLYYYNTDETIGQYGSEKIEFNFQEAFDIPKHVTCGGDMSGMGFMPYSPQSNDIFMLRYALVKGQETDPELGSLTDRFINSDPSLQIMMQMAGNPMLSFMDGPGRYTFVAAVYDEDDKMIGTPKTSRVYYMPKDEWDWTSLGMATVTEDFLPDIYELEPPTYEVEIQESKTKPGLYRLVNLYGSDGFYGNLVKEYTVDFPVYTYIDCTSPEACYIYETSTGAVLDTSGEVIIGSEALKAAEEYGYGIDVIKEYMPELFGKLSDGEITFGSGTLIATAPVIEYAWLSVGSSGSFRVILPKSGLNEIEYSESNNAQAEYYNLQGMRVANPVSGNVYIRRQGDSAKKIIL